MINKILFSLVFLPTLLLAHSSFLFIPNNGQWHEDVFYKSSIPGGDYFIDKKGITYSFYDSEAFSKLHQGQEVDNIHFHCIKIEFEGIQIPKTKEIKKLNDEKYNYFLGNNPKNWANNLQGGKEVLLTEVYPKIDLRYTCENNRLKYEFIVHPGGNPHQIKYKILGADSLDISRYGLTIHTSLGNINDAPPLVFQSKGTIPSYYNLNQNEVSFEIGNYNPNETLVIDPEIVFSTYSGSSALNFGYTATYDNLGFLYAGGSVFEAGYPVTAGAFDISFNSYTSYDSFIAQTFFGTRRIIYGVADMAISKYDTSGTKLIYSTYIGGNMSELPHSLVVNEQGELYILGTTGSNNFPVSNNAYNKNYNGGTPVYLPNGIFIYYTTGTDMVVTKLSADGKQLLGSSYLGGSGNDGLNMNGNLTYNYADQLRGEIILSNEGEPIIASSTFSNNYPTKNAIQNQYSGNQDGVITKLKSDLSDIIWSSYYGGTGADAIYSIEIDKQENILVAGGTTSPDILITDDVYRENYSGGRADGMLAKIKKDGSELMYSGYFGTDAYDQVYFIRSDAQNNVYIFGQSEKYGNSLIFNAPYNRPNSGQFITKFQPDIKTRIWSTTFGTGNQTVNISPTAFSVDVCNKIYLSGWGSPQLIGGARGTAGLEVTRDAFQASTDNSDFYFMVLEDDASALYYATFFGGNQSQEHVDGGTSRFDTKGHIYQSMCAGCGGFSDMPIHPQNAHSALNLANCNNGVLKFDFQTPFIAADFIVPEPGCINWNYEFTNKSKTFNTTKFTWYFGDGNTSNVKNPSNTYTQPGNYTVKLVIEDENACNLKDSIEKNIVIRTSRLENNFLDTICKNQNEILAQQIQALSGAKYNWYPTNLVQNDTILNTILNTDTALQLTLTQNYRACIDTFMFNFYVPTSVQKIDTIFGCENQVIQYIPSWFNSAIDSIKMSTNKNFTKLLNNFPTNDTAIINLKDTFWLYISYQKENCNFLDSAYFITRVYNYLFESDTILCSTEPINRVITKPPISEIVNTTWGPSQHISNATLTSATLTPYNLFSQFTIEIEDIYGCIFKDEINFLDLSIEQNLNDQLLCFGDTVLIGFDIISKPSYTFKWTPENLVENPDSIYTRTFVSDSVSLQLIVSNGFCIDTFEQKINVIKNAIEISPKNQIFCNSNFQKFNNLKPINNADYQWFINNNNIASGNNLDEINTNLNAGTYQIKLQVQDIYGCIYTDTTSFTNSFISVQLPNDIYSCNLADTFAIQPSIQTYSNASYYWEPYFLMINDTTEEFAIVKPLTGENELKLWVTNQENCIDSATIKITQPQLLKETLNLSINPNKISKGEKTTVNVNLSNYTIEWNPIQPQSSSFNNYVFAPTQSSYITATIKDEITGQCFKTDSVFIEMVDVKCEPPYIFVPNAFTPNNDGKNDNLYVRGRELNNIYFAIFNRWGEKVFESNRLDYGWDGTFKGELVKPDVFDYYLEYDCDGVNTKFLKGNVTVIR